MKQEWLFVGAIAVFAFVHSQDDEAADTADVVEDLTTSAVLDAVNPALSLAADVTGAAMVYTKKQIQQLIRDTATRNGIEPALMLAYAQQESDFNPYAVNLGDPSYGLFGIQPFWLTHFGYGNDEEKLFNPAFSAQLNAQILRYFMGRINPQTDDYFAFPAEADIYNMGETQWAKGKRKLSYRDSVLKFYRAWGGTA